MDGASDNKKEMNIEHGKCEVCSVPATTHCSACSMTFYCSSYHQKKDWKVHKQICKPYSLKTDAEIGYHYVATRNLSAGTIILSEIPLCYAPNKPLRHVIPNFVGETKPCFGCNAVLMECNTQKCSKCKISVCSSDCEKMPVHANNECKIYQKVSVTDTPLDMKFVFHLRTCLAFKSNPSAFDELTKLNNSVSKDEKPLDIDKVAVEKLINDILKISDVVTAEDWIRIVSVIVANKYNSVKMVKHRNDRDYLSCWQFLSLKSSLFLHSCIPNCYFECSPGPDMKVIVRTATAVKKGEMLSMNYFGDRIFFGNYVRQRLMKHFICKCRRCLDPSEMGSNLMTFVCKSCKEPKMMSMNPLTETSEWKCNSCGAVEKGDFKIDLMDRLYLAIEKIDLPKTGTKSLENLISKLSAKIIHPNHCILIHALLKITQFLDTISDRTDSLNDEQYRLYVTSMEQLIAVSTFIAPGMSFRNASIQYSLAKVLLRKVMLEINRPGTKMMLKKKLNTLDRVTQLLTESNKFFKNYLDTIDGSQSKKSIEIENRLQFVKETIVATKCVLINKK